MKKRQARFIIAFYELLMMLAASEIVLRIVYAFGLFNYIFIDAETSKKAFLLLTKICTIGIPGFIQYYIPIYGILITTALGLTVGLGLRKLRNWARVLIGAVCIMNMLDIQIFFIYNSTISLVSNFSDIALATIPTFFIGWLGIYFFFSNKKVIEFFSQNPNA